MKFKEFVKTPWFLIIVLSVFKLSIHLLTNSNYEIHRDGLLYYSLGQHLDWGYMSVPPFIAVISRIATDIFGANTFAMRLFPALIGAASVMIIAHIVMELKGNRMAILLACMAFILSPAFLRSNTLLQPVSFNQFFWLFSGYLIIRMINRESPGLWIWVFVVWGVAFLNKYSISVFMIAILSGMLISRHRKILFSRYFLFGAVISLIIIAPNILWQYRHGWPLIFHMAELQKYQLVNVSLAGFLIDQLMMNLSAIIVWVAGLIALLFFLHEKKYRFIGISFLLMLLVLIILRGKSYYSLGFYSILMAFGGYALEKYGKTWFQWVTVAFMVFISIPLAPFSLPLLSLERMAEYSKHSASFTNRWEDGELYNLPQDYADMTGWKELVDIVGKFYQELPEQEKKHCLLYAENYGQAGALLYYGEKYNLPDPVSFNDNFLFRAPDSISNGPLIYVNHQLA